MLMICHENSMPWELIVINLQWFIMNIGGEILKLQTSTWSKDDLANSQTHWQEK